MMLSLKLVVSHNMRVTSVTPPTSQLERLPLKLAACRNTVYMPSTPTERSPLKLVAWRNTANMLSAPLPLTSQPEMSPLKSTGLSEIDPWAVLQDQ